MNRRDFYRFGTIALGNAVALALAVPGVAYVLDPLRKSFRAGGFQKMARLSDLLVNEPRSFPVVAERTDAWVKYPPEPVGSVWLVRRPDNSVTAFTAECPHLGCAVNLRQGAEGKEFLCPCHTSAFDLSGKPLNAVPPRGMDTLEVELSKDEDPAISVKFRRFRTQEKEKTPLA